jgi:prevent-host-death family protein
MDRTVTFAQAKNQFADLLDRVIYRNERITITKRGKPVATISGMDDVEQRERAKDRERVKRIREIKKRTKKYIPFEQVVRDYEKKWGVNLGLDLTRDSNVRD